MPCAIACYCAALLAPVILSLIAQPSFSFSLSVRPISSALELYNGGDNYSGQVDTTQLSASNVPMNTPARKSLPRHLRLKSIPGKGLGVITTIPIRKNTVVGDYQGEILTAEEKDRRYLPSQQHLLAPADVEWLLERDSRQQTVTGNYVYGVSCPGGKHIYIDAEDEYHSLWTRFLNHGPPPIAANLNPKSIHESYDGKPRVWFVSTRDIESGEELCFDYGDDYWLPEDNVV